MKASKTSVHKYMKDYIMLDENGFEYISSKTAKEMISVLPRIFENVIVFTEFGKETGLKYLVVRSNKGYANFFYAYISDQKTYTDNSSKTTYESDKRNDIADEEIQEKWYIYSVINNEIRIDKYIGYDLDVIVIPKYIKGLPVVEIGEKAFMYCNAQNIIMPDSVRIIGKYSFSNCSFTTIHLPTSLEVIKEKAFYDVKLIELELPLSVKIIEKGAFWCHHLKSLTLNEGLVEIADDAFSCCRYINSLKLPTSLKKIGIAAFSGIGEALSDGVYKANVHVQIGNNIEEILDRNKTLNGDIIDVSIFSNNNFKVSITIYCENNSIAYIHAKKFGFNTAPYDHFSTEFEENSNQKINWINAISYSQVKDGVKIDYIHYEDFSESNPIPNSINGLPVVEIGDDTSFSFRKEKKIKLPVFLKRIGCYAMRDSHYESLIIPNTLEEIGEYAFSSSDLKFIDLSNCRIQAFPKGAFSNCIYLENIIFPEFLKRIEELAFEKCQSLKMIDLPETVEYIGQYAFTEQNELHIRIKSLNVEIHPLAFNRLNKVFLYVYDDSNIRKSAKLRKFNISILPYAFFKKS